MARCAENNDATERLPVPGSLPSPSPQLQKRPLHSSASTSSAAPSTLSTLPTAVMAQPQDPRYQQQYQQQYAPPAGRPDDYQQDVQYPPSNSATAAVDADDPVAKYGVWNVRIRLALGLMLPTYLETLDYTIVATAQPHIASTFNRLDLQSWIGTTYVLTSTIFLPIFGSIADVVGRHWAMQMSLWIFMVGSAICTGAHNMPTLLVGRGIAGIGAAGLMGVVRIILSDSGSLREDNFLTTMLFILYAIGYSTGPIIGGALLNVSFRWIFAINLPAALLSSIVAFLFTRQILKGPQPPKRLAHLRLPPNQYPKESVFQKLTRIDWIGCAIFIGGGILVLLALSLGSSVEAKGFAAPVVIVAFTVGFFLIILLVLWEWVIGLYAHGTEDKFNGVSPRRYPGFAYNCPKFLELTEPMIPISLFKNYDILVTSYVALTAGMVLFSAFYFLAIYFSIVKGLSAQKSGEQLLYFAPGMGGGALVSMRIISIIRQPKYPIIAGTLICTVGIGLLSYAIGQDNQKLLNGFLVLTGIGIGAQFGPMMLQARFSVPTSMVAVTVSMNLFFRNAGGTIGLAQLSAVLNTKVTSYINGYIAAGGSGLSGSQTSNIGNALGGSLNTVQGILDLDPATRAIVQDAFKRACRWSFISLLPWVCVGALLTFFLHTIPLDVLDRKVQPGGAPMPGAKPIPDEEKEGYETTRPQRVDPASQPGYVAPKPWQQVPTPRGPITLIIWPIRVFFVWLGQKINH